MGVGVRQGLWAKVSRQGVVRHVVAGRKVVGVWCSLIFALSPSEACCNLSSWQGRDQAGNEMNKTAVVIFRKKERKKERKSCALGRESRKGKVHR